ncbi:MAG: hypothetical protein K6E40_08305 [Desulfovibrio sp.]|nr:hypothetical protein [Desulfovibrio sp.]
MRIPKYRPYEEPAPRRAWSRDELRTTVRIVRDMLADEQQGCDPRRLERIKALADALGREPQTVRLRLCNVAAVLRRAELPAPACLPDMPSVGRRTEATILDCWHELDATEDMAASKPTSGIARRPWTTVELKTVLEACRRMVRQEEALGRPLDADDAGDRVCEVACQLGRRWSETRRVMAAIGAMADVIDGTAPRCLDAVAPAVLDGAESAMLERLRRENGRKEG